MPSHRGRRRRRGRRGLGGDGGATTRTSEGRRRSRGGTNRRLPPSTAQWTAIVPCGPALTGWTYHTATLLLDDGHRLWIVRGDDGTGVIIGQGGAGHGDLDLGLPRRQLRRSDDSASSSHGNGGTKDEEGGGGEYGKAEKKKEKNPDYADGKATRPHSMSSINGL